MVSSVSMGLLPTSRIRSKAALRSNMTCAAWPCFPGRSIKSHLKDWLGSCTSKVRTDPLTSLPQNLTLSGVGDAKVSQCSIFVLCCDAQHKECVINGVLTSTNVGRHTEY